MILVHSIMNNLQLLILEKNENSAGVKSAKMAGPGLGITAALEPE